MFWVFFKFGMFLEKIPLSLAGVHYTHTTPRPYVLHPIYVIEAAHVHRDGRAFV